MEESLQAVGSGARRRGAVAAEPLERAAEAETEAAGDVATKAALPMLAAAASQAAEIGRDASDWQAHLAVTQVVPYLPVVCAWPLAETQAVMLAMQGPDCAVLCHAGAVVVQGVAHQQRVPAVRMRLQTSPPLTQLH